MKFLTALFLTAATLFHSPAMAQDFVLPPLIDSVGMGNIAIGAAAMGAVDATPGTAPVATSDLGYLSDPNRTAQNIRAFVNASHPSARANLQAIFSAQPLIIEELRAALAPYGIDTHDLGDVYAFWWINSWLVANQRMEDPDQRTIDSVKKQAAAALAEVPGITSASDAERQDLAEGMLIQGLLLSASFEQWKNNPALLAQLAEASRASAHQVGVDLDALDLTPEGFAFR